MGIILTQFFVLIVYFERHRQDFSGVAQTKMTIDRFGNVAIFDVAGFLVAYYYRSVTFSQRFVPQIHLLTHLLALV